MSRAKTIQPADDPGKIHPAPGIMVDRQIREARQQGWLRIDPFDEEALQSATYDLGVGDMAVLSTSTKPINLRDQRLLTIEAYASALIQTEEILHLSPKIAGRLGPRSNLLRHGIFVSAGPQIDPGFTGRLFVSLLNVTDHPFLIRHRARFLSVEFHALQEAPEKLYAGPHQNKTELSEEEINLILGRGGASLREVHQSLLEVQAPLKEAAALSKEIPSLIDLQQSVLEKNMEILSGLRDLGPTRTSPLNVPITTFAPEPYEVLAPIPIVIQPAQGGFIATFFDANVSSSGDTQEEALANLRSLILDLFEDLETEGPEKLGPEPARQIAVLRAYARRLQ